MATSRRAGRARYQETPLQLRAGTRAGQTPAPTHPTFVTAGQSAASPLPATAKAERRWLAIAAGNDGSAAARQVERICTGWRLRKVCESFVHRNGLIQTKEHICASKVCSAVASERCQETGGLVAATVLL